MKKANFRPERNPGFSLVELLVVLAILAILMGLVTGIIGVMQRKALESQARAQIAKLQLELDRYLEDRGSYPPSSSLNLNHPTLGEAFFAWYETRYPGTRYDLTEVGTAIATDTGDPLRYARDPWGQPFIYHPNAVSPNLYRIGSKGPDTRHGSPPDPDSLLSFGGGDDLVTRKGDL